MNNIKKDTTRRCDGDVSNYLLRLKEELKENQKISLGLNMIKNHHNDLINMDDKSFAELMSFEYNVSSFDVFYEVETDNDFGYFIWKKLKEREIKSLNSVGIPDATLDELVRNKISVWELHTNQIKSLIKTLAIDATQFTNAVSNFDLTILNMPYNKNLLARLDSSVDSKNNKADLIVEGSYDLFIARQEKKRQKFLKECQNLLY